MSIASEIQRLSGVRSDIFTSITNKGVTVPETATFSSCPDLIDSITTGAGAPNCIVNTAYTAQATGTTTIPFTATQKEEIAYTPVALNLPFSANYFGEGEGGWNLTKRQIAELSSKPVSAVLLADAWDNEWEWNPRLFLNYGVHRYVYLNIACYFSTDYPETSATITIPSSSMSGIFSILNSEISRGWGNTYDRWTACGMDEVFGAIHPPAWKTQYFENNPPTGNWVSGSPGDVITSATEPGFNQMSTWSNDFNMKIYPEFSNIFDNLSADKITFKLSSDSIGLNKNGENIRYSYAGNSGQDNYCGTWTRTRTEGSTFEMTGTITGFGNDKAPATYPVYLNFPYTNNQGGTAQPLNGEVEFTYLSGAQMVIPYPNYAQTTTGNVIVSGNGIYKYRMGDPFYTSATRTNDVTYNDGPSTSFNNTKTNTTMFLDSVQVNLKDTVTGYDTASFVDTGYNYNWGNATTSYSSNLNVVG